MKQVARRTVFIGVIAAFLPNFVAVAPSHADGFRTTPPPVVRKDAKFVRTQALQLRRDVESLLSTYTTEYGDRFSDSELGELTELAQSARRDLASVVVTTGRLWRVVKNSRSPQSVARASANAERSLDRSRRNLGRTWTEARSIAEPELNFLEKLQALGEYEAVMDSLDEIDATLDLIPQNY